MILSVVQFSSLSSTRTYTASYTKLKTPRIPGYHPVKDQGDLLFTTPIMDVGTDILNWPGITAKYYVCRLGRSVPRSFINESVSVSIHKGPWPRSLMYVPQC